jgi:hypothetical protein
MTNLLDVLKEIHKSNTAAYQVEFAGDVFRLKKGENNFAYFRSLNGELTLVRYDVTRKELCEVSVIEATGKMAVTVLREYSLYVKSFAEFIRNSVKPLDF